MAHIAERTAVRTEDSDRMSVIVSADPFSSRALTVPAVRRCRDTRQTVAAAVFCRHVLFSSVILLLLTLVLLPSPSLAATADSSTTHVDPVLLPNNVSLSVEVKQRVKRAPFIDDDVLGKLMRYGYLPESDVETGALRDESELTDAIKQFQRYAHIPESGVVDARTRQQFNKPRCGLPDVVSKNRRYKRYALQGEKWEKTDLTWTVSIQTTDLDATTVYHELRKALKVWSDASVLTFQYVHSADADIIVSFHRGYHQDGYPFDGKGQILAHAFFPGEGRGGDAHFDEDELWMVDINDGPSDGVSLFAVAVHEFGHSLGLSHSSRQDALMFPWYQVVTKDTKLPPDDRIGLEQLYGSKNSGGDGPRWAPNPYPPQRPPSNNPTTTTTTTRRPGRRPAPTRRPPSQEPDPCDATYDALSVIRGETFIFSGEYFWRLNKYSDTHQPLPIRIRQFWYGLPKNLTKIDAIYERLLDHKIVIFIGRQYWVFGNNEPDPGYPQPLTSLGLPDDIDSIDAAMVWGHNGKTYFFKNHMYWRFDEVAGQVEPDYPRDISVWRGVPSYLDSAFLYGGVTYFFKGSGYWQFNDRRMHVQNRQPQLSAVKWMNCPVTRARSDKLFSHASRPHLASLSSVSFVTLLVHIVMQMIR